MKSDGSNYKGGALLHVLVFSNMCENKKQIKSPIIQFSIYRDHLKEKARALAGK